MPERISGRMMEPLRLLLGACLVVGALACASTPADTEGSGMTLQEVRVERDGDATVVQLVGIEEPVFTAYRQQGPERVTVDLASVQPAELQEPVAVYDGLVEEVTVTPFSQGTGDGSTRVELLLATAADYVVEPSSDGLAIRVAPVAAMAAVPRLEAEELASQAGAPDDATLSGTTTQAATKLVAVDAKRVGDGVVLELRADGAIESAGSFTLEAPDRLVIDLPGLVSEVGRDQVAVGSPQAERVRIGQHDGMVRVVVDGGAEAHGFEGRRVVPVADGLVVALGSGAELELALEEMLDATGEPSQALAAAEAAAQAVPAAPAPADSGAELATVQGVEFDSQAERDRITVVADRPLEYVVHQPDADTVVVSVPGARLQEQLDPRIAPEPGGPVSLVTAFEQPEMAVPEVRIVVERAPGLEPQVTRQGSLVVIEFPRSGGRAATPPVLASVPAGTPAAPAGAPAAIAPAEATLNGPALAAGSPAAAGPPASLEPPAAISLLQEGGIMDGKEYTGRRISLDFKDIEMADVLRLIADVSDLNVIAGDEVKGKVTIRLVDVPWDQALDVILLTKGLGFMRVGNVLRIAPADLLKKEEEARLQERRALEQLEDLVVKLQPVNYATVNEVQGMVKQLLTPRGTVQTDKRTNTLIIKDIPSVVDEAVALVKAVDTQTPQVMIESKIVEASLDFSRDFGVVWGFGTNPNENQHTGDIFSFDNSSPSANTARFINPVAGTGIFSLAGSVLDDKINVDLTLQAAEANGDGKVISSPRLVTLDNNKATIEQGVSIPFQTFENGDAQLEFVDAVLKLDVTPHITADRSIIMKIVVSRNAPDPSVFTLTGSPAIAKNQVNTETLVKDGQTLVIGGIYVIDQSEKESSVPYAADIPLLGALFRNNRVLDKRKELLIFVTPRVVQVPQAAS